MDGSSLAQFVQQMQLDVEALREARVREVLGQVLNLVEEVVQENRRLLEENERLRKLLHKARVVPPPKPPASAAANPVTASGPAKPGSCSSEKERRSREGRKRSCGDRRSFRPIHVDRDVPCPVDRALLPPDASFVGYDDLVVQDLIIRTDNVRYRREIWVSPTQGRFHGSLPPGVHGEYGPRLRTLLVSLKYVAGTSLPRAQALVEHFGIALSPASVVNILHEAAEPLKSEKEAIFRAGLAATTYQHVDDTSARVGGELWHTHLIGSPLHASYFTRANKDRLTVLDLLRDGPRTYRFSALTQQLLEQLHLPQKWRRQAAQLPQDRDLSEEELTPLLAAWQPPAPAAYLADLREAAAIASYRARPDHVRILVGDDAKQFRHLADTFQLCWIHEGRHYQALSPVVPCHQQQWEQFRKSYWDFYGELQAYRGSPTASEAERLRGKFDELFRTRTGYDALDRRITRTRHKKHTLLTVLEHPEVPLHNNPAELDERVAARRRDVSLHCRNAVGAEEMDTFTSIVQTAKKLAVNGYEYLYDRISGLFRLPSLASLIRERALSREPPHQLATPPPAPPTTHNPLCVASV